MRTAELCPTCATFTNALCVLYNGEALTNTNIQPLDTLSTALTKINNNLVPETGTVAPTTSAVYLGQNYLNTATGTLYYAITVGNGAADWSTVQNATIIDGAHGGTGIANTGKTITLGGNLITSGAYPLELTISAATSIVLPTSGTVATISNAETFTNKTLSAPSITGGTIASATITTPTVTNGTFTSPTILSPIITSGGTINGTDATVLQVTTNISNTIVADAASTTKYPSVNAIKGYIDQFQLNSSAIVNLTLANTVITTSLTQVSGVTSPGSLAVPTSPVSGTSYIVWNSSVLNGVVINTTDSTVFFGQGGFPPGNSFTIPYLSIFSFSYIAGSGWLVSDLTIVSSTLVYSSVTIGAAVAFTPTASVTSISGIGTGGTLLFPTNKPQIPEFIINNAASNSLVVNRSGSDVFFGPGWSGTVTTLTLSTNTWTSFRYVAAGGWLVTTIS